MLIAHLVPGYFAAALSQPYWNPDWNKTQRNILWFVAFAGTVAPDTDVIYNMRPLQGEHISNNFKLL